VLIDRPLICGLYLFTAIVKQRIVHKTNIASDEMGLRMGSTPRNRRVFVGLQPIRWLHIKIIISTGVRDSELETRGLCNFDTFP